MPNPFDLPPIKFALARMLLRAGIFVFIAYLIHRLLGWMMYVEQSGPMMFGLLFLALVVYALLIAVPFVPGIEIGISLMMIRGAEIVPYVYLATVCGLLFAFFAGRLLPYDWLHRLFLDLRLTRACDLLTTLKPLSRDRRLALLRRQLPWKFGDIFVHSRHIALALLINVPGNALIGGGGGICLIAGLSRLYSSRAAALTIVLAVLPIPILVWGFGINIFENR